MFSYQSPIPYAQALGCHRSHPLPAVRVRNRTRQRIGSIIGGFDAAQAHRRLRGFRASRAHVNTLIAASGETITARARWLVRDNGFAANAVDAFANHVGGDGIKPSSLIEDAGLRDRVQKLWLAWTDEADALLLQLMREHPEVDIDAQLQLLQAPD